MRRIVWMLAIGGLLGVPVNPGFAQSGASANGETAPAAAPKRYVRYYSAGNQAAANAPTAVPVQRITRNCSVHRQTLPKK